MTTSKEEVIQTLVSDLDKTTLLKRVQIAIIESSLNQAYEAGLTAGRELYRVGW